MSIAAKYVHRTIDLSQTTSRQKFVLRGADLCPATCPATGLPLVIESITLVCQPVGSVAGTAVSGEDIFRAANSVRLDQIDKVSRFASLRGAEVRLTAYDKLGTKNVREHADLAIAAIPAATEWHLPLTFRSPMGYAEHDFEVMPPVIEKLTFTGVETGTDGVCVAGGTLTFTSAVWYALVTCRRVTYMVNGPSDTWAVFPFNGAKDLVIPIDGGLVGGCYIKRDGTNGGGALSSITSLSVDEYGRVDYTPADLLGIYERARGLCRGALNTDDIGGTFGGTHYIDPSMQSKTLPIVYTTPDLHAKGRPIRSLNIHTVGGSSYSDLDVLMRVVNPRHDALREALESAYLGPDPRTRATKHSGWRLKTRDRTMRDARAMGGGSAYIPMKSEIHAYRGLAGQA